MDDFTMALLEVLDFKIYECFHNFKVNKNMWPLMYNLLNIISLNKIFAKNHRNYSNS